MNVNLDKPCVIIESPCSGDFETHRLYLKRALLDSLARGEAPIASHGLFAFSGVLDDANPEQRQLGMEAGWNWMLFSDVVAVYQDYGISPGMQEAIGIAGDTGIEVEYRTIGTNDAARPAIANPDTIPEQ